jgi:ABC-type uncharacterized transport system substrate-binding protein
MNRRELMLLLAGMMTPRALRAQQKAMAAIGYLSSTSAGAGLAAFHQGLSETGYIEGQNLAIEYRLAEGRYDRLPALAADLVGRKVDVIVTRGGTPSAQRNAQPRRSRSSLPAATTRSRPASSPVSPGQAATLRASAFSSAS